MFILVIFAFYHRLYSIQIHNDLGLMDLILLVRGLETVG